MCKRAVHLHVRVCVSDTRMHARMPARTQARTHARPCIHALARTHAHTHTRTRARAHAHVHTHAQQTSTMLARYDERRSHSSLVTPASSAASHTCACVCPCAGVCARMHAHMQVCISLSPSFSLCVLHWRGVARCGMARRGMHVILHVYASAYKRACAHRRAGPSQSQLLRHKILHGQASSISDPR